MICPFCGGRLGVIDTAQNDREVYRRRKCLTCRQLVYTQENRVEPDDKYRFEWAKCMHNKKFRYKK